LGFYDLSDISDINYPENVKEATEKPFKPFVMVNGRKIKLTRDPKKKARIDETKLVLNAFNKTQRKILLESNHSEYK